MAKRIIASAILALAVSVSALTPLNSQIPISSNQGIWNRVSQSSLRSGVVGRGNGVGGSILGSQQGVIGDIADQQLVHQQQAILNLLLNVQQPSVLSEVREIASKWDLAAQASRYANTRVVRRFLDLWQQGTLPRDQPLNILDEVQLNEVIALFDLLYFANDFDTLYRTACWARQNVNQGQFVYALSVAVIHRPDTQAIQLPPIYEIWPHVFLDATDVQQLIQARLQGIQQYVTVVNNSGLADITNQEQILSYLTEDIGLNAYNAHAQLYNPFWLNSAKYGLNVFNRGENYWYINRQILALYNLNRIANGLPELESLDWAERTIVPGYNSGLQYANGEAVPARPDNAVISSTNQITIADIQALELRIKNAIDSGYVITREGGKISIASQIRGINILGNIVEGNADSVNSRYYGAYTSLIRSLVALITDPDQKHGVAPGPLANPAIALRDPAFYIVQQHINGLIERYQENLPSYHVSDLAFPGVSIKDVVVDQLVTYFDLFDVDVSNLVGVSQSQERSSINYVAKTIRLNHKPFSIKVNILSERNTNGILRIFLGPKQDVLHTNFYGDANTASTGHPTYDLDRLRKYFVELDRVPIKLTSGVNVIERASRDLTNTVGDIKSLRQLLQQVQSGNVVVSDLDSSCGIPDRLVLPLGSESGLALTLYVVVTPIGGGSVDLTNSQTIPFESVVHQSLWDDEVSGEYQKVVPQPSVLTRQNTCTGLGTLIDRRPLGFPLDRPIRSINQFYTPNQLFKDVVVYHLNTTVPGVFPSPVVSNSLRQ